MHLKIPALSTDTKAMEGSAMKSRRFVKFLPCHTHSFRNVLNYRESKPKTSSDKQRKNFLLSKFSKASTRSINIWIKNTQHFSYKVSYTAFQYMASKQHKGICQKENKTTFNQWNNTNNTTTSNDQAVCCDSIQLQSQESHQAPPHCSELESMQGNEGWSLSHICPGKSPKRTFLILTFLNQSTSPGWHLTLSFSPILFPFCPADCPHCCALLGMQSRRVQHVRGNSYSCTPTVPVKAWPGTLLATELVVGTQTSLKHRMTTES